MEIVFKGKSTKYFYNNTIFLMATSITRKDTSLRGKSVEKDALPETRRHKK